MTLLGPAVHRGSFRKRKQWVEVITFGQDCETLSVLSPVSQAGHSASPQENANLMDLNEHLALLCGHDKKLYIYVGAKALLLASLVLERLVQSWSLH